jgi:CRISPR type I-D-associated protein Csc2
MNATDQKITLFAQQLADVSTLPPREVKGRKVAQAIYTRQVVTIVGVKTTAGRFLPVSHAGYSNETYVDKVDLLGKTRAEFIGRKLKGIERRAHMSLFREMVEAYQKEKEQETNWRKFFAQRFGTEEGCTIPDKLCLACWNCSLFGGMESKVKKAGTFSRIRYFDTFSVDDAAQCIQTDESPEQMAIGNVVYEDLSREGEEKTRGAESFHRYEYVKAGTRFPFITIIESPTLLDVAGYLAAVKLADQHGYGKYSANHGKFETTFLAVSTGYPLFSVLNMLGWLEQGDIKAEEKLKFETVTDQPVSLFGEDIAKIEAELGDAFKEYVKALDTPTNMTPETDAETSKGRGRKKK